MNTNVGDMPLDIFTDYISDTLGEEWSWEYLAIIVNYHGYNRIEVKRENVSSDGDAYGYNLLSGFGPFRVNAGGSGIWHHIGTTSYGNGANNTNLNGYGNGSEHQGNG
jgi:hypothetical protein